MSKFDKFKEIFAAAEPFAKPFVPGGVGKVLDVVNDHLNGPGFGPVPSGTPAAIQQLAADNDEQTQAILALHERVKRIEDHLGLSAGS